MQLNVEQQKLVTNKPNSHSLIKGVAGSGKTTVAVCRIPFLLHHYCFDDGDRILMVTYNRTLIKYIQYLYNKVEQNVNLDFQGLFFNSPEKIEIETIDSILCKYFNRLCNKTNTKYQIVKKGDQYSIISKCVALLRKDIYNNVKILDQKNLTFLLDEIDWIKS